MISRQQSGSLLWFNARTRAELAETGHFVYLEAVPPAFSAQGKVYPGPRCLHFLIDLLDFCNMPNPK
jgi:hypothetical protein